MALSARRVFAIAASLLLAVLVGWWIQTAQDRVPGAVVATVELVHGDARWAGELLQTGAQLLEGAELSTAAGPAASGRLAVRMNDGQSLRLDEDTVVRLASGDQLELVRGAVYVDSPPSETGDQRLDVVTALGTVVEIGTQYEVRIDETGEVLDVRVREGAVSVHREGRSVTARLGEALTVRRDGSVSRGVIAPDAAEWLWVLEAAPPRDIEGDSLGSFLEWVSRETGWEVAYASSELEESAPPIVLHGTIEGLRPDETVGPVLLSSGLEHEVENGILLVSRP